MMFEYCVISFLCGPSTHICAWVCVCVCVFLAFLLDNLSEDSGCDVSIAFSIAGH